MYSVLYFVGLHYKCAVLPFSHPGFRIRYCPCCHHTHTNTQFHRTCSRHHVPRGKKKNCSGRVALILSIPRRAPAEYYPSKRKSRRSSGPLLFRCCGESACDYPSTCHPHRFRAFLCNFISMCDAPISPLSSSLHCIMLTTDRTSVVASQEYWRPIHESAHHGRHRAFRLLAMAVPQSLLLRDAFGWNACLCAVAAGHVDIVASPVAVCPDCAVQQDDEGNHSYSIAALLGQSDVIAALLACCPDGVTRVNDEGETVLHVAARMEYRDIVGMLLTACPSLRSVEDRHGRTPFHSFRLRFTYAELLGTHEIVSSAAEPTDKDHDDGAPGPGIWGIGSEHDEW